MINNRNTSFHVNETIDFLGKDLDRGRVIHTSSPDGLKAMYGDKISEWPNWPEPFMEVITPTAKKRKSPDTQESGEEASHKNI